MTPRPCGHRKDILMKKQPKKIVLTKETLRHLTETEAAVIAGGLTHTVTCPVRTC
jgi:hypothetical protein